MTAEVRGGSGGATRREVWTVVAPGMSSINSRFFGTHPLTHFRYLR